MTGGEDSLTPTLEESLALLARALDRLSDCVKEDSYGNAYLSIRLEKD